MKNTLLLSVLIAFLACISARAAVIVEYQLLSPSTYLQPTVVDPDVTASNLSTNNTTFAYTSVVLNEPAIKVGTSVGQATADLGTTLANSTYFSFTVTPDAGESISFDSLTLNVASAGPSTRSFYVFSSIDGFTTSSPLLSITYNATSSSYNQYSIDLGSLSGFSDVTTPTEFRIYIQEASGGLIYFSEMSLTGTVVPEPTSVTLLAAGGILCAIYLRRRRS